MEFEKSFGNITIGGGTAKTAGKGDLSEAVPVKRTLKSKADRKFYAKKAAAGVAALGVFLLKRKLTKKSRKK